ncbi:MAG TPA: hypothetical protein VMQ62_00195 [Dongiaceae bacterium]|nr:hypothetical protein [Dongiaceae bacterium]
MFLLEVVGALDAARVPYLLVGGYAVALHGAVRGTVDIDLVIRRRAADFERLERALQGIGLQSRLPVTAAEVFQFREEYLRNRKLRAWTFMNPSRPSEIVDVVLSEDAGTMKADRVRVEGRTIRLASVADLIRMKSGTGRRQDEADVEALKRLQPGPRKR